MSRNTTIDEAVRQLEELLANKEVRRIAEAREKNIMDEQSLRKLALTQGLEQGLEKGRKEGRNLIIKKMIDNGLDIKYISELTSISIEDIEKIKFV